MKKMSRIQNLKIQNYVNHFGRTLSGRIHEFWGVTLMYMSSGGISFKLLLPYGCMLMKTKN